jgi:hypothetical protein
MTGRLLCHAGFIVALTGLQAGIWDQVAPQLPLVECATQPQRPNSLGSLSVTLRPKSASSGHFSLTLYAYPTNRVRYKPALGTRRIERIDSGTYRLVVRQVGYAPFHATVTIVPGQALCGAVLLRRETTRLTPTG